MESPRTVWVTHPSFKNLSEDDEVQVSNYFQSVRSSGGGSVDNVQRVMSHDNQQTSALLFEFSDAAIAARVCSRSHKLADIFSAPEDYALPEQSLTVTIHNTDLPLPSPASNGADDSGNQSWVVLDEFGDTQNQHANSPGIAMPTYTSLIKSAKIEVYEFPDDCYPHELLSYFEGEPFKAFCQTSEDDLKDEDTGNFIMEFTEPEIQRILSAPNHYLDEDDADTMIKVRLLAIPVKQVMLSFSKDVSSRHIKKYVRDLNLEKVQQVQGSKRDILVTFSNAEDAERYASQGTVTFQPGLSATVKLCEDSSHLDLMSASSIMPSSSWTTGSEYSDRCDSPISMQGLSLTPGDFSLTQSTYQQRQRSKPPAGSTSRGFPRQHTGLSGSAAKTEAASPRTQSPILPKVHGQSPILPKGQGQSPDLSKGQGQSPDLSKGQGQSPNLTKGQGQSPKGTTKPKPSSREPQRPIQAVQEGVGSTRSMVSARDSALEPSYDSQQHSTAALDPVAVQSGAVDQTATTSTQPPPMETGAVYQTATTSTQPSPMETGAVYQTATTSTQPSPMETGVVYQTATTSAQPPPMETGAVYQTITTSTQPSPMETEETGTKVNSGSTVDTVVSSKSMEYSHVEIKRLFTEQPLEMHNLLEMHIEEFAGPDWHTTKYQHSYDSKSDVLRFDMSYQDIVKFLGKKQCLFEDDDSSLLSVKPLDSSKVVTVAVVDRKTMKLGKKDLLDYFGADEGFSCKVDILYFSISEADLQMETYSAASLVVNIGEHSLKNSVKVRAIFASEIPREVGGVGDTANVVVVESTLTLSLLKKFMQSKHKGSVTQQLSDCCYTVEFTNPEDAKKVLEQEMLQYRENKILVRSYDSFVEESTTPSSSQPDSSALVSIESNLSHSVLKKYMQSKHKGTIRRQISSNCYIVEFEDPEEAKKVVQKEILEFKNDKILAKSYFPEEEKITPAPSPVDTSATYIEVKAFPKVKVKDMFQLLEEHFQRVLGDDWAPTKIEHSYDDIHHKFRFDLSPSAISQLTKTKQFLDLADPSSELQLTVGHTGKEVVIRKADRSAQGDLSKTQIRGCFGPKSTFRSTVTILSTDKFIAEVQLESCSLCSRLTSKRLFTLKNEMRVEVVFPDEQTEGFDDEMEVTGTLASQSASAKAAKPSNAALASFAAAQQTLLVDHLLDVDHETLYLWVKSLTGCWPRSIQLSADGEKAVVRVPTTLKLDVKKLEKMTSDITYHLHGERLAISDVLSTSQIQVICSSTKSTADAADKDIIETYFSNPKYTGIKDFNAMKRVKQISPLDGLAMFIVTYAAADDVDCVIRKKPHKQSQWRFDVAEYYADVGVCKPDSLVVYPPVEMGETEDSAKVQKMPALFVSGIDERDLDTLRMLLSSQKRSGGGAISSCDFLRRNEGLVKVVYEDPEVAERVYSRHCSHKPLYLNDKSLEIELELPWLTDQDDDHRVRVSGLTEELDPEKLRFYLSALSNNSVTQMSFNKEQTRAIAEFEETLDFGLLLSNQHKFLLPECSLKIQQEPKPYQLIATGSLTKDGIELPLENLLRGEFNRDVDIVAEQLTGHSDKWLITTSSDVLEFVIRHKDRIPRCETLSIHSDFLGPEATCGVQKKADDLSNFVADNLLLYFLQNPSLSGHKRLEDFLCKHGISLAPKGVITSNLTSNKQKNREVLKKWRKRRQLIDDFIRSNVSVYYTQTLTQQVFNKLKPGFKNLFSKKEVVTKVVEGEPIGIAGMKGNVEQLTQELTKAITKHEAEIRDEKATKTEVLPNVLDYQLNFLKQTDFFTTLQQKHKLKGVSGDVQQRAVAFTGVPANIEAAQRETLNLLPHLAESKVSEQKKPLFLKVFKTSMAEKSIRQELLAAGKLQAVWTVENRTLSVYSVDKPSAVKALKIINEVVWEAQYPQDREFDEAEKKLLISGKWNDKKAELCKTFEPLEIVSFGDKPGLGLAGLAHNKGHVLEEIPFFFAQNVMRKAVFDRFPEKIYFLSKYKTDVFKELEGKHNVKVTTRSDGKSVSIEGTRDDNANFGRSLDKHLKDIFHDFHTIDDRARVQHINDDPEFLETVGLKNNCLVVKHVEGDNVQMAVDPEPLQPATSRQTSCLYSVTLPSGTVCEVKRADITSLSHDAIVNAANGDLQHIGGLAYAIAQKGGFGIQQECNHYIRKYGKLMEGEVMTSSPGNLSCKKIIHAVGPRWVNGGSHEEITLFNCIDNCFLEIEKEKMQSIAIPPISTGIFGFPVDKAVKAIVGAIEQRVKNNHYLPQLISLVDNKSDSLQLFETELRQVFDKSPPRKAAPVKPSSSAKAGPSNSSSSSATGKYTITDKTIKLASGISIELVYGDLVTSQEDTLINSVGNDMNLSSGKVAVALSNKAGPQLQAACTALAPIAPGDVKETDGFNLACKKVLHCNCPQWQGPQTIPLLKQIVMNCLNKAASNGHVSIAFPALGTGNLNYPPALSAQYMIEAVMEYSQENPKSSITQVKVIVFHLDIKTKKGFEDEITRLTNTKPGKINLQPKAMESFFGGYQASSTKGMSSGLRKGALKGCVTVHNTKVRIVRGDITDHKAEALVNSTDGVLSITGQVSQALIRKAGNPIRKEVQALSNTPSKDGLWVSGAGNLSAKFIFHINAHLKTNNSSDSWSKIIRTCLEECDKRELQSIAFPALGTGNLGLSPKDMAKMIVTTVAEYLNSNSNSFLINVDLIVFHDSMVEDFISSMRKATEKKQSFWQRLSIKMSNFFYGSQLSEAEPTGGAVAGASEVFIEEETCKLAIYANSPQDIQRCKLDLDTKLDKAMTTIIWKDRSGYAADREFIVQLTQNQIRRMKSEADKLRVNLTVDQRNANIKINGRQADVYKISEVVSAQLKNIEKGVVEKKEEELVALARQWEYEEDEGQWAKFDTSINKALEDTYLKNANAIYSYETSDGAVKVDIGAMKLRCGGTEINVRRLDLSKPQTTELSLPSAWTKPLDTYGEVTVGAGTPEYIAVETAFMSTLGAGGSSIIEIKRVQNPTLYKQYLLLRKDVAKRLGRQEDQVETTPLWHGTDVDTVSKITIGKFDRGYIGKNAAAYGNGTYFAKNSSYSAQPQYSKPDRRGHRYIIQTRVITGDWTQGQSGMKAAPYKNNSPTEQYDSVVENIQNPTIFVVFHDTAAYPEYIIKYV